MTYLLLFCFLVASVLSKDICNNNVILRELDSFKLSQLINKNLSLDYQPYIDLFSSINANKGTFEKIVTDYTKFDTFTAEEPANTYRFDSTRNVYNVSAKSAELAVACSAKGSDMVTIDNAEDTKKLMVAMKHFNMAKVPIKVTKYGDILSNFKGIHLAKPADANSLAHVETSWAELSDGGIITYPSAAVSTTAERTGLCIRPNNFWDQGSSNRYTFMNLMGKLTRMLPLFNKNTESLEKVLKSKHTSTNNVLRLLPPAPLIKLKNLVERFSDPAAWQSSVPLDYSTITDIVSLFKKSKNFFSKISQKIFPIQPDTLIETLKLNPDRYLGGDELAIISDKDNDQTSFTTTITDTADSFVLYEILPHVHKKSVPKIKYLIKGSAHSISFIERPTLLNCKIGEDDSKICSSWAGQPISTGCLDYLSGSLTPVMNNCEMITPAKSTVAVRCDCQIDDGLVVSSSIEKVELRLYCDGVLNKQFLITQPVMSIPSTCELREFDGTVETVLAPQLNEDLIDTSFNVMDNLFAQSGISYTDNNLLSLLMNILPMGLGTILFIVSAICATYFCMRPARFIELINCLCRCQVPKDTASRSPSRNSRPGTAPGSPGRTPLTSRPTSRAASPARSLGGGILLRQY